MMTRSPDVLFITEYIKNVLYFATVRQGKVLKSSSDIHYFSIDNELLYENYYSDFRPLNLGCIYKYCKILNEKLKQFLNKQTIVHYTSFEAKKKTNSAFLIGCYGVLYLSLSPRDALKPLLVHGQSYRPFQDATQGESTYTISLLDCLQAIKKAQELGFFHFPDFNYEEYERLDKIQGGDLNWIVPGKFLAFIGPVDYNVSLYHPPEMYIDYFQDNYVKIVIRLNKRMYNANVFTNAGIVHYDLFFPDGSCPPRHILFKFLQISEEADGAIAVHCKAGLGRTGSLIGCYLIKHYRMTSHEAIGWMRICRPGSVIGHQQAWLEKLEPWLIKQGNFYRKRTFQDTEKFPIHEFGVYSIAEKTLRQRPVILSKSPSPPPPINRQTRSEITPNIRPQASRVRQDKLDIEEEEVFITACDLTTTPTSTMTQMKGCVIKNNTITEEYDENDPYLADRKITFWKKYLCCQPCIKTCNNGIWMLAVRCARVSANSVHTNRLCVLLDMVAPSKTTEKEQYEWGMKLQKLTNAKKVPYKGDQGESTTVNTASRRGSGAGEPRVTQRSTTRSNSGRYQSQRIRENINDPNLSNMEAFPPLPTFCTTQGPVIKTLNDARNYLLRSSMYKDQREQQLLNSSIRVTPHYLYCSPNSKIELPVPGNVSRITPSSFGSASRAPTQTPQRRRLGRSPSPSPNTSPIRFMDRSRATNTPPSPVDKFHSTTKNNSKSTLKEALSRLRMSAPRDGSIGAASLGARRDAPAAKRAPSVRSDERPLATQGDMLNSIKFQRRFRDTLHSEKPSNIFHEKVSLTSKDKSNFDRINSKTSTGTRFAFNKDYSIARDQMLVGTSKAFFNSPPRPSSPRARRNTSNIYNY